ncbi:MAG: nucleotide exchange factor GrpE [Candidatus Woesearchaeota archaeon]
MAEKKKNKKQDIQEITLLLKKVQADFENYQKRSEKEKQDFVEYSSQNTITELLPILDSFDHALKHSDNKDIKALYDQLWNLLSSKGLEKIKALDKKFDPYLHEALMQEKSDKEEGIVLEELQTGYKFKDNVIRPTKVKVSGK